MKTSKLVDNIQLEHNSNEKYNLVEVLIDLDDSSASDISNSEELSVIHPTIEITSTIIVYQMIGDPNIFDKLYTLCIRSQLTSVVRKTKA